MDKKWLAFWLVAGIVLLGTQGCGNSLDSWFISAQDERNMGDTFNMMVEDRDPSLLESGESLFVPKNAGDSAMVAYYQTLGKKVVAQISSDEWEELLDGTSYKESNFFKFQVIQSKQVNAFAVPGGYVYFYTGIFKEFKNEAELVGVLAHEIGHITRHHSRENMVDASMASTLVSALAGDGALSQAIGKLGLGLTELSWSRENEFEADSMSVKYSVKAGVAPTGIQTFFGRTAVTWNSDGSCEDAAGSGGVFVFLSTHPGSCDRIKSAKAYAAVLDPQGSLPDNADTYMAKVQASTSFK